MDCEYMRVENGEMSSMNDSSSWMNITTMAQEGVLGISTLNKSNQVFCPSFYPIASVDHDKHLSSSMVSHSRFAKSSYHMLMQNQDTSGGFPSYLSHCPSSVGYVKPITMNASSSEMNQCGHVIQNSCLIEESHLMDRNKMSEQDFPGSSPNERRGIHQPGSLYAIKDNGADEKIDLSGDTYEQREEKEEKYEKNTNANNFRKQKRIEAKGMSGDGESFKENYIHVRARRGQASNSHSLAERVRREKISERMRLLQELVPGCNKITGKAVMLDEIINYVQSLQQQVEFLSMKLATIRPQQAIDLTRITSEHDLLSQVIHTNLPEIAHGNGSFHPYNQGNFQKSLSANPNPTQGYHTLPQSTYEETVHSYD